MKNTIEQLEVMDNLNLENTVGGYSAGACLTDIVLGTIGGVASGAAGGPLTMGIGYGLGQIGGSIKCATSYLGGK